MLKSSVLSRGIAGRLVENPDPAIFARQPDTDPHAEPGEWFRLIPVNGELVHLVEFMEWEPAEKNIKYLRVEVAGAPVSYWRFSSTFTSPHVLERIERAAAIAEITAIDRDTDYSLL
jgi:hypothetical protein